MPHNLECYLFAVRSEPGPGGSAQFEKGDGRDAPAPRPPRLVFSGTQEGVASRLAEVARAIPDALALCSFDGRLTFADLDRRVEAVASALDGAAPADSPVGVYAEQGTATLAAMLGVMATGRAVVMLDVPLPIARLAQITKLAGLSVVVADADRYENAARLPGVTSVLRVESVEAQPRPEARHSTVSPTVPATLVFTSGSTGRPKGVMYTHEALLANSESLGESWHVAPGDRVALVMPAAFSAGQVTLLGALLNGAAVSIRDPRLRGLDGFQRWLCDEGVTILACSPAFMRALDDSLGEGEVLPSLRLMISGGEKAYGRDVERIRQHLPPGASYMNWVGSTEGGVLSAYTIGPADQIPRGVIPAGRALPLQTLELLDEDGGPVPPGEIGLLHATSRCVSAGYWGDQEQTAGKYVFLPDGRRRFGTGDKGRLDANGDLHLLGRADDSVKIRGYLVEPAEVEAALVALPDVQDAVVRAQSSEAADDRLVAWVVPAPETRTPSPATLRAALARSLPEWMVPRDVVLVEVFDRTERGKIDVSALPAVPPRQEPIPPRTATEAALEKIWAPILQLEHIGRDESFTALGGDSLAIEEMLAAVSSDLGVRLVSAQLAEHPTLEAFAGLIDAPPRDRPLSDERLLVRLRRTGSRPPLFCFAGAGGGAGEFESLAGALGLDQPVHALQARGFESRGIPDWTVDRIARRYVDLIRQIAPNGPVFLAGHSLGGLIALSAAPMLLESGHSVPHVTLLDTFLPLPAGGKVRASDRVPDPMPALAVWRAQVRVLRAGIAPRAPDVQGEIFYQHGVRIARRHQPPAWSGRTLLFVSNENDDDLGRWDTLLVGDREIHRLNCDHRSVLLRPYVERVATLVTRDLDMIVAD